MLPHQHVFWGAVFAFIILIILPDVAWYNILLLFLSTFLIDFDHYLASLINKRKYLSLRQSFKYHMDLGKIQYIERKRGIRRKGDFHIFHTLEFHILVFIIGLFFRPFMFIFIGMAFHSLLDIISLIQEDFLYRRDILFCKWIKKQLG